MIYHSAPQILSGQRKKGVRQISKDKKEEQSELCCELDSYRSAGIRLWLEGLPSTPEEIARACCMREGKSYMRDYIRNAKEQVTDIAFDSVQEEK